MSGGLGLSVLFRRRHCITAMTESRHFFQKRITCLSMYLATPLKVIDVLINTHIIVQTHKLNVIDTQRSVCITDIRDIWKWITKRRLVVNYKV